MPDEKLSVPPRHGLFHNWISLAGAVFAAGSIFAFVLLFALEAFLPHSNPYIGILVYVVAPACFVAGLLLVLVGLWAQRRLKVSEQLTIDLSRPHDRKLLVVFALGSLVFLLATAFGSYQTYHYTESVEFCGVACHLPMNPEYTTYLRSPHARVACVECHVGDGAKAYVHSKLNGMKQLYDVVTNQIPRPIATPVRGMLSAKETCEECHWPGRVIGDIDRTFYHYLSDDENTPFAVRLLLKVGGGEGPGAGGIHVHAGLNKKVEYIATDDQRQVIPWVRVTDTKTGSSTIYRDKDFNDDPAKHEIRTMDCIDCHNRPAHQFHEPNDVVDEAITAGRLDRSVPKLKLNVVTALVGDYKDTAEAMQKIASTLHADYPDRKDVDGIVTETQQLFRVNFFPEMKTDWRAHPNNIGHKTSLGCFRCHDGNHKTDDGTKSIAADNCNTCHIILAQGKGDELKDIKTEGHDFHHIDSTYLEFSCTSCHTGAIAK